MKPLIVLYGLTMLLTFSSCDTSSEDPLSPLLPQVQVGDMWIMNKEVRLGPAFTDPSIPSSISVDTFRVQKVKQVNGNTWYNIESSDRVGLLSFFSVADSYYSFREDGVWQLGSDDSEIHIIQYPVEQNYEYQIFEGVFSTLVNPDTLYSASDLGTVPAVRYQNRYSTEFRPFAGENNREDLKPLPLERELIKEAYFSSEFGLLRKELFYVTARGDTPESATIIGSIVWELVAFVPAQ